MQADERELILSSLDSDAAAYGVLVERYKKALYHHCFCIVRDEDAAEDIAQEAFITAYYKLAQFDQSRKFSTWLFKIATNKALNHVKKFSRNVRIDEVSIERIAGTVDGPNEQSIASEIRRIVDTLQPNYRAVVSLYYWEGKSYSEIAEIMNKPEGTIKGWLSRAKEQLRKELA